MAMRTRLLGSPFRLAGKSVFGPIDWRNASREPVGLAPNPSLVKEAVIQVYGARAVGAKGLFGVHTWVAVKPSDALSWTVYEVIGWRLRWSDSVVVVRNRDPDGRWRIARPGIALEPTVSISNAAKPMMIMMTQVISMVSVVARQKPSRLIVR